MKKLLVLAVVLAVTSLASASFLISVNGVVNPGAVTMNPSDTVTLDITGAGNSGAAMSMYLLVSGPGISSGGVSLYGGALDDVRTQSAAAWDIEFDMGPDAFGQFGFNGVTTATVGTFASTVSPQPALNGKLADLISLHGETPGVITLTLVDQDLVTVYNTQSITVVPEPATIALLCLGGLLLRKKK
jgi:hypothetical protein